MSLALSDQQVDHIMLVSRPLQPKERTAFMAALFEALLNYREQVGDGELGHLLRDLQHRHFTPPAVDERETARVDSRSPGFHIHHLRPQTGQARRALGSRRSASGGPFAFDSVDHLSDRHASPDWVSLPTNARLAPTRPQWVYKIKHDGFVHLPA